MKEQGKEMGGSPGPEPDYIDSKENLKSLGV